MRSFACAALIVIGALDVLAQDLLNETPNTVVRSLSAMGDSLYTVSVDSAMLPTQLRGRIDGPHPFTATYRFADLDWDPHCDSIVYQYSCSPCFDSLVASVLASPYADWRMLEPDKYIKPRSNSWSKPKGEERIMDCTVLQVHRTPGDPMCGTLIYSFVRIPQSQRKQLLKRLNCEWMYYPYWGKQP